jgi:hypothetical protein
MYVEVICSTEEKEEGQLITATCMGCCMLCLDDVFQLKLKAMMEQYENTCGERTCIQGDKISSACVLYLQHSVCCRGPKWVNIIE